MPKALVHFFETTIVRTRFNQIYSSCTPAEDRLELCCLGNLESLLTYFPYKVGEEESIGEEDSIGEEESIGEKVPLKHTSLLHHGLCNRPKDRIDEVLVIS